MSLRILLAYTLVFVWQMLIYNQHIDFYFTDMKIQSGHTYEIRIVLPWSQFKVCTDVENILFFYKTFTFCISINPQSTNHNYCRLLWFLPVTFLHFCKQCGPRSDCSFSLIWVHTGCLYAKIGLKCLQEYSADDINRRHFQMQVFLAL